MMSNGSLEELLNPKPMLLCPINKLKTNSNFIQPAACPNISSLSTLQAGKRQPDKTNSTTIRNVPKNQLYILRPLPLPFNEYPFLRLSFEELMLSRSATINPYRIGFAPRSAWKDEDIPFAVLVATFFQKRNSLHCKFPYKLFNALRLTDQYPVFNRLIGIRWVTDTVFMVERQIFARLLGIRSIDGSLFHQQGNFPSHGCIELTFEEASLLLRQFQLSPYNPSVHRLFQHSSGKFTRSSSESIMMELKWIKA